MFYILTITNLLTSPVEAINNSHLRCDKVALEELNTKYRAQCLGANKRKRECIDIEKDIIDYLTAFHTHNNAFCVRLHEKYALEMIPAYKRNPKRVL